MDGSQEIRGCDCPLTSSRKARAAGASARAASTGYYEISKQVCIDSRRSRLVWGSGNARRNRMPAARKLCAGFPNPDSPNVGVLDNR